MGASGKILRVDTVLRNTLPQLSRTQVDEALAAHWVVHESGRPLRKGEKLARPSELDLRPLLDRLDLLGKGAEVPGIKVIHSDSEWVVIDKPAGVPSHPLRLADTRTVTHWAFFHYPEVRAEFGDVQPTLTPHRLDTGTSGLLVVALSSAAYGLWREHFSGKKIEKRYLAWVWGVPHWQEKEITHRCGHSASDDRRMVVKGSKAKIRGAYLKAQMVVRKVREHPQLPASLIEATCSSGVMHQVRLQLSAEGLPLVGDSLYDSEFKSRSLQPPFHLLRAFQLKTPLGEWRAETESFSNPI